MIEKLENHIAEKFSFLKDKKLLLATSGGVDSMVMVDLFQKLNLNIAIAHCNFQLRGLASFEDQNFIETFADTHKIPVFTTQFDTENFAKNYKLSTQVAARTLRYDWFNELLKSKNYDYLLTAHHLDDSVETFLINLIRGTGLQGFTGIPEQNEQIIRPLLIFSREEIENYAQENNIQWREDESNATNKYVRNKIRHQIVPVLKELNSNFLASFQKTQNYLQEAQNMVEDASIMIYQQVAKEIGNEIHFDLKKLKQLPNYKSYLYQWLAEYDFTAWDDIYNLVDSQTGKQVFSDNFILLKNRDFLILSEKNKEENREYYIQKDQKEVKIPLNIVISHVYEISEGNENTIFVDEIKIKFPLVIKKWNEGAIFEPFGMNGKSKKVSKFFKDEKLSILEKQNVWILYSDNQIVWIIGMRQDHRFKIEQQTKKILKISLL